MVSVVIPTFNRFEMLDEAIKSVQKQTFTDFEIIVVDDCSDDPRYSELTQRTDIRYFRLPQNSRLPAVTRNLGITQAYGDWIAFLDDDDVWEPRKLELQMAMTPMYNFICTESYYEDQLYARGKFIDVWNQKNPENTFEFTYELLIRHNLVINSSVLVRKDILFDVGLFTIKSIEDYDLWLKITRTGHRCLFIPVPLLRYRINNEKFHRDDIL